ncbi:PTS sugar transporter subunit IIA [Enterococcus hermanniensis]|uniref:PTS EIIA type-4 domain-containing protein n=1 Tax=Enterococcus hermanniensis TaxID=249189 RepID=A0A1L8TR89_9ENTE|nr:PTS mannose transporter subunit IIA [Enterococcus hermanniensis]OJG46826.1 hypothetical protein RV04_GL000073 [Enterococcus hermanniensis]
MRKKIILASHGHFASGILSSLRLICGENKSIEALDCYVTKDFDLQKVVEHLMLDSKNSEIIVITDIFGGSVNNEFLKYIEQHNFYLIAGLNLPFLIELSTKLSTLDSVEVLIRSALEESKHSIQFCNDTFNKKVSEEEF